MADIMQTIFYMHFVKSVVLYFDKMFVHMNPKVYDSKSVLVPAIAWRRTGD